MKRSLSLSFVEKLSQPLQSEQADPVAKKYKSVGDFVFSEFQGAVEQLIEKTQVEGAQISVRSLYSFLIAAQEFSQTQWQGFHDQLLEDPYCNVIAQPLMMINRLCQGDTGLLRSLRLIQPEDIPAASVAIADLTKGMMNIVLKQLDMMRRDVRQGLDEVPTDISTRYMYAAIQSAQRYYQEHFLDQLSQCPEVISPSHMQTGRSHTLTLIAQSNSDPAKWRR